MGQTAVSLIDGDTSVSFGETDDGTCRFRFSSADLGGYLRRQIEITLSVDLGHVSPSVPKQHLGRLQPVLLPHPRGERVPELVRVPPVRLPPRRHLRPLDV